MGKDLKGKELGEGLSQKKNGKYRARVKGSRKEKDFEKLADARKWKTKEDFLSSGTCDKGMTVDEWFDIWHQNVVRASFKPQTVSQYKYKYTCNVKPILGEFKMSKVRSLHCQRVLNEMSQRGLSTAYIEIVRGLMKRMFDYAVANRIIDSNPINKYVKAKGIKNANPRKALTREEQEYFVNTVLDGFKHKSFIVFLLSTGVRAGEGCGLKWSNVDFERNRIYIKHSTYFDEDRKIRVGDVKTKSGDRFIPMSSTTRRILLEEKLKSGDNEFVFTSLTGDILDYRTVYVSTRNRCDAYGFRQVALHELRHTFATRMVEEGMSPKVLQKILGHARISITLDIYTEVQDSYIESEANVLENVFNPWGKSGGNQGYGIEKAYKIRV